MSGILHGLGVSSGVAVGRVLLIRADTDPVAPSVVDRQQVDGEIESYRRARARARAEIADLRDRMRGLLGDHYAAVFEAQLLILDDPGLVSEIEGRIRNHCAAAPWALREAVAQFTRAFEAVDQGFFRDRGGDLADVHRRLQRHLRGHPAARPALPDGPQVLVAHSLGPSEAVALVREGVVGMATDVGGATSHTAILAQALSIPAVVGLRDASRRVSPGETVILDGSRGELELSPGPERLAQAALRREQWLAAESATALRQDQHVATSDGVELVLRANIELPDQVAAAVRHGAQGIGLYRSEFLYLTRLPDLPSEEEHYQAYRSMAEAVAPHPAVIRTLDLGGERFFREISGREESNPVLGLRAVRFCLQRPDVFLPQLRGLLRAAAHGSLRVLIPLVTDRDEIRQVRALLATEAENLKAQGIACRSELPVGAMVEVPAAALVADQLAREVDFLAIGTNDLIQYALAVDRGNESVAHLYRPLHPAILRMIDLVVRGGAAAHIPVSLCGEMAASSALAALLVGMGLREFSVEPRSLGTVAEALRRVDSVRSAALARDVLEEPGAPEVARKLIDFQQTAP